jgi:SAM-dependent methyltransferase
MRTYRSKFEEVARYISPRATRLLDVGCRDGRLKRFLPGGIEYTGIDLVFGPQVTKVCNVESGIPYSDNAFDVVVALDLLEHIDNIWYVFSEFVRIARQQIMVVLPNAYDWRSRLRFLRGKERDKYRLTPEPIQDRHRWLTSYATSRSFALHMARKHGLRVAESISVDDRRNVPREVLAHFLSPNLMSIAVFFMFEKASLDVT